MQRERNKDDRLTRGTFEPAPAGAWGRQLQEADSARVGRDSAKRGRSESIKSHYVVFNNTGHTSLVSRSALTRLMSVSPHFF